MQSFLLCFVALLCLASATLCAGSSAHKFEAHRLFQVDAGDTKLGSRKASFHHLAAPPSDDADFSRRAVVFRWKDVTADMLENVVEDAAAIVISLPPVDESLSDDDLARWFAVEALLSNSTVPCPLYFVENSAAWSEVVDGVLKGGFDGTLTLAVDAPPPKRLDAAAATNFQTFFSGSDGKHTIAIVAHYDSASPAPTLARGATSNGSGMVLLFALLRLFRTLYDDETTRPAANLMFVITAAGHSNYAGTRHWLINSDSRLLDSVDFVLCIDSVGLSDGVHLHVSRPLKDDATKRMYGSLQSAAAEMTPPLPFTMHQRKIDLGKNVSGMDGWHHEVIPRSRPNLRILAATLSSKPAFSSEMRASILDRSPPPLNKMIRDFEFATRAVSKMLYAPHAAATVLKSSTYLSSSEFIKVACETVAMTPRSAAHTSSPSPVLDAIASLMSAGSAGEMSKQTLRLDGPLTHYTSQIAVMEVFQASTTHAEFLLSAVILAYCFALFVYLRGSAAAIKAVASVFRATPKSHKNK